MLKESGYIILDYERVVKLDDSEGEGKRILKEASELLKLKQEDMPEEEKETLHIYEKTEINTALNEHYMSYVLDKHKEYKMATSQIKSM